MLQKSPMFAYLPAKDVSRARQFYEQKLGFKPKREIAMGGGGKAAWFKDTEGNILAIVDRA